MRGAVSRAAAAATETLDPCPFKTMQLENILPSASINLPKTFYNLSSSDSANTSPRASAPLEYQELDRTEPEAGSAPKKYLSAVGSGMLGEGEAESFPKAVPDGRKGSPMLGEDDLASGRRYTIDDLGSDRYFISSSQASSEMASPCSLFPYAGQSGSVYTGSSGSRYPASLHYGSVLPPTGFSSSSVCTGRSQFSSGGYQFGQGPGCLYPSYPGTGTGIGSMSLPGSAAGARAQVYLCNRPLWLKFHRHQTEMIITKQGR